jgi:acyl-homoserine lactone acylase PvdQ
MVTVLVTSILLLVVIAFAIYRWQRVASSENGNKTLPSAPDFEGLFAESIAEEQLRLNAAQLEEKLAEKRSELLTRAGEGDKSALSEAHQTGNADFYDEVLDTLVQRAENAKQVFALASYLSRNGNLPINVTLARAFTDIWKHAPDRHTTAEMLHVAALAGDSAFYQQVIEFVLQYWREQRLQDIKAEELIALIESEFWLIPSNARDSGAGFLLKRELAKIRRELAAITLKQ